MLTYQLIDGTTVKFQKLAFIHIYKLVHIKHMGLKYLSFRFASSPTDTVRPQAPTTLS